MIEPELALALSAREWSDHLRRFLADHGGARVRVAALEPHDLAGESFDVLLIDDICSFLTPRLVERVAQEGRAVIGVCDATELADGGERLRQLGVDAVVEAGAHPDEFLEAIQRVAASKISPGATGPAEEEIRLDVGASDEVCRWIAIVGPGGGTGVTEVAIASAAALAANHRSVLLVDGDDTAPSIAQRLGADLFPNVRVAVDALEQRSIGLSATVQVRHGIGLLVGVPSVGEWQDVRPRDVIDVMEELGPRFGRIVVDLGGHAGGLLSDHPLARSVLQHSDQILVVAVPTPVGVTRLLALLSEINATVSSPRLGILINRAPKGPFLRGEVIEEIRRSYPTASLEFIPDDGAVGRAAWNGVLTERGKFRTAIERWITRFDPAPRVS